MRHEFQGTGEGTGEGGTGERHRDDCQCTCRMRTACVMNDRLVVDGFCMSGYSRGGPPSYCVPDNT